MALGVLGVESGLLSPSQRLPSLAPYTPDVDRALDFISYSKKRCLEALVKSQALPRQRPPTQGVWKVVRRSVALQPGLVF